ncbi:MAG: hypothetical protein LR011_08445 [Verrucomicrobia bacterium]|nr:hypothetical protein [Verrucomicrobiota bacterium]
MGGEKELAVEHLLGYGSRGADRIFDEATRKDGIVQKWRWRLPASLRNRIPQARSQVYRLEKICQLVELYPEAFQPFSDRLGKWMRDENPIIKAQAMRLLRMYPATAKGLETRIVQAVSETGPGYVNGILLLESMGASHETMVSVIQSGFESDDYRLRARAVEMAQRMGLAPGLVVPVLRSIIEYGPFDAAFHAIGLAGKVGPTASELIPVIEEFVRTVPDEVSEPPGLVEQTLRCISATNMPNKNFPDFEKK